LRQPLIELVDLCTCADLAGTWRLGEVREVRQEPCKITDEITVFNIHWVVLVAMPIGFLIQMCADSIEAKTRAPYKPQIND
jgi:hypothetical protein